MASKILIGLVVLLHVWFFVLEVFLWNKPFGRKLMRIKQEEADATYILAMNQGLYNLMVASYILWACYHDDFGLLGFVLASIILAGIFGAISAKKPIIFFIQAIPATLALIALHI